MSDEKTPLPTALAEVWSALRPLTAARIGLPRSGASLGTSALLDFRLAHAQAKDAVGTQLDAEALTKSLQQLGLQTAVCHSAAEDRRSYLMRPDLGRQLSAESLALLDGCKKGDDLVVVLADGLSAQATQGHALPLLQKLLPALAAEGWSVTTAVVLHNGRVAAGDAVAIALAAGSVLVLIGERPGLSSPDSLGAYLTWAPTAATSDAERNCVSNIRPDGFVPAVAAGKIAYLLGQMRQQKLSGVGLKDDMLEQLANEAAPGIGKR